MSKDDYIDILNNTLARTQSGLREFHPLCYIAAGRMNPKSL